MEVENTGGRREHEGKKKHMGGINSSVGNPSQNDKAARQLMAK